MLDVDIVYHLAGVEWHGAHASLMNVDILGTQTISQVAADAGVKRFFYMSHLGADRASAYPVLKAKAIAEENIRRSGVNHTIIRSALVFGLHDHFTSDLARIYECLAVFLLRP